MSKTESFFNGFSKVFNVAAFSGIVLVVGLLALKSVLEYRIETKQEVVVEVMKSATQDTQEAKASVMRALMSQEAFRKVAAPWIIRITSLEYQGYYPERDTLFLQAIRELDPIELKTFLNTTEDMFKGFPEETKEKARRSGFELPPVIKMSSYQRMDIQSCQEHLNEEVIFVANEEYQSLNPLQKVINDFKLAFPEWAFEACDL